MEGPAASPSVAPPKCRHCALLLIPHTTLGQRLKPRAAFQERHLDSPDGTVALFGNNDLGLTLQLGVVGPGALGKEAQNDVHQFIGKDQAQGWSSELQNEPGIDIVEIANENALYLGFSSRVPFYEEELTKLYNDWLHKKLTPEQFHLGNALARFDRVGDLFDGVLKRPQRMEDAVDKLSSSR